MTQLFVDLDGVLADFDTEYFRLFREAPDYGRNTLSSEVWSRLAAEADFYRRLRPMPDAFVLWRHVEKHDPVILTGAPRSIPSAADQKRGWVAEHLGAEVPVICCPSRDKSRHIGGPGDILIDDWEKYRALWVDAGGRWITHRNAAATVAALDAMLLEAR